MSRFVMDEKFFDKLAAELIAHVNLSRSSLKWAVQHALDLRAFPENRHEEQIQQFAQECYAANITAVNYRYQESYEIPALRFTKASGCTQWSSEQLIKYLECLSYQCAEGDCEQNATYRKLEALIGHLARAVVGQSKGYEAAQWDYAA